MRWNDLSWLKSNRKLLVAECIAIPLVVAWLLFIYFETHNAFALVVLFLIPFFSVVNVVIINRSRGRLADPGRRLDSLTGDVLALSQSSLPSASQQRWTGAVDMPGSMGRMNASAPLGIFELTPGRLSLRVRPGFLASMFGIKPLRCLRIKSRRFFRHGLDSVIAPLEFVLSVNLRPTSSWEETGKPS